MPKTKTTENDAERNLQSIFYLNVCLMTPRVWMQILPCPIQIQKE